MSYKPALCIAMFFFFSAARADDASISGHYLLTARTNDTPIYLTLALDQNGEKLTGMVAGIPLVGERHGSTINFVANIKDGGVYTGQAELDGQMLKGMLVYTYPENKASVTESFTGTLVSSPAKGPAAHHDFVATKFYREFSAQNAPVLHISPGDSVHTTTVDAAGNDEKGINRAAGGNPATGPFYVDGALPGDTLVIHLTHLRLNRDWALSDDGLVSRGMNSQTAVTMKDVGNTVYWHLDLAKGRASPEKPGPQLIGYSVPLRPMLGCIAVAPEPAGAAPSTQDSGRWGGNIDFNEITEGSTVYLPVRNPGALLYVGDGHAAQGDGEMNGNALETSMDVEFTVDVIPGKSVPGPRVITADNIVAMGLNGSIDDSFRDATANMVRWLTDDYKLTPSEIAEVLGTSAQYRISEAADRNAGVVLLIDKTRLKQ